MINKNISRPVLRWHGGKWRLAPWIISHFPPHRIYTEVFGGGASVLLRKHKSYAEVYNDLDNDVVNLFEVLRNAKQSKRLRNKLYLTPFARGEFLKAYDISRDPVENARRLVVRSFMGFGSNACNHKKHTGFRGNSNRSGTTPAHDWANYPSCLLETIERLRGVIIEHRPALKVLQDHDRLDALHYVDPPYIYSTRRERQKGNYLHEMSDADHRKLAEVLKTLKGMIIISGYPSKLYDEELYPTWTRLTTRALADKAQVRTEVIWLNRAAVKGHAQIKMF